VHGVGLPGHFMAGYTKPDGTRQLIDVYESGELVSEEDAARIVLEMAQREVTPGDLRPVTHREIITRMLRNLIEQEKQQGSPLKAIPYLEVALKINPDDAFGPLRPGVTPLPRRGHRGHQIRPPLASPGGRARGQSGSVEELYDSL